MRRAEVASGKQVVLEAIQELWRCYVKNGRPMTEDTLGCLRVLNHAKEEAEWLDDKTFSKTYPNAIRMARALKGEK